MKYNTYEYNYEELKKALNLEGDITMFQVINRTRKKIQINIVKITTEIEDE